MKYVYEVEDSEQGFLSKLTSSDHPQANLEPLLREAVGAGNDRHSRRNAAKVSNFREILAIFNAGAGTAAATR